MFKMFFQFKAFDVNDLCRKTAIILTVVKCNYGLKVLVMNNIKKFYIKISDIKYSYNEVFIVNGITRQ